MKNKGVLFLLVFLIAVIQSGVVMAEQTLTFGLYTSDKPSDLKRKFDPVLKALEPKLSERLGVRSRSKSSFPSLMKAVSITWWKGTWIFLGLDPPPM